MNEKIQKHLLELNHIKLRQKLKNRLIDFSNELKSYDKETLNFYNLNPGYYNNLKFEKEALLISEPEIKELKNIETQNRPPIRIIYAILGLKHSFDDSIIDVKRLKSKVWIKYRNLLIEVFHLSNIEDEDLEDIFSLDEFEINDVLIFVNMCLNYWCGNEIILNEQNQYYMSNNGFNILTK